MKITGRIVKGIAGFYYVDVVGSGVYECKAKGIFRKNKEKPLVGDLVELDILSQGKGNITAILPRSNQLIRPAVANVDQALIVFAVKNPSPQLYLLDRFLVMMEGLSIPVILLFNKSDLDLEEGKRLKAIYEKSGYQTLVVSSRREMDVACIKPFLRGKVSVLAGPSGVGKSSLINGLQKNIQMETGKVSEKIGRGKHTTRHSELIMVERDTYIMDTPGFGSLHTMEVTKEGLKYCFHEFEGKNNQCRFPGCDHIHEPGCKVKEAVEQGKITKERYESYCSMYRELKEQEQRRY